MFVFIIWSNEAMFVSLLNLTYFSFSLSAYGGRTHIDPEELFRNIFGDNFNFKNFQESDDYESTQYGFAQASEVCKSYQL